MKKLISGLLALGMLCFTANVAAEGNFRWDCAPEGVWAQLNSCEDAGWWVEGEALFWKPCRHDLDFAHTGDEDGSPLIVGGKTHYLEFDYEFGFRVGVGYRMGYDGWDLSARWTELHAKADGDAREPTSGVGNAVLLVSRMRGTTADEATTAHGSFDVDYDVLDVLVSRPYFVSRTFLLRPFAGLRILWLDQDLSLEYRGEDFNAYGDGISWTSDYTGAGMHGGIKGRWKVSNEWNLYGSCAGSIVFGSADNYQRQIIGGNTDLEISEEEECLVSFNSEAAAGISWEHPTGEDSTIMLSFGYELVYWSNIPTQRRFTDSWQDGACAGSSEGTLGYNGFVFNIRFDF